MTKTANAYLVMASFIAVASMGCRKSEPVAALRPVAFCNLKPTLGNSVVGRLELQRDGDKVHITGEISGLRKKGEHGFHIHEIGDCSAPDAKSAGEHFAPAVNEHGPPGEGRTHHAGDFGNLTADQNGIARIDLVTALPLLTAGQSFVVGRSFVVHEGKDDLTTQPSGNAGARVACGVIEPVAP